jgi:TolA-binding protein
MRKISTIIFICLVLFLSGCGNDQYAIEKQYWQAQRRAEKIFKNPSATPPNELAKVVGIFRNFAKKHEKNILATEAEFNIARLYIVKEEYEKARTQLRSIINEYKKSENICAEAAFLLGNSYEIENKWHLALAQYKKIMQEYPITFRGLSIPVYIAEHYKIKYEPDKMIAAFQEAIAHYKQLASKYPNTPLALNAETLVAQCYLAIKEWQNAINALNVIIEDYKGKIKVDRILLSVALIYDQQLKNKAKAAETLQKLIQDYPKSRLAKPAAELLKKWEGGK